MCFLKAIGIFFFFVVCKFSKKMYLLMSINEKYLFEEVM